MIDSGCKPTDNWLKERLALLGGWLNVRSWLRAHFKHSAYFLFYYLIIMATAEADVVAAVKSAIGLLYNRNLSGQNFGDVC